MPEGRPAIPAELRRRVLVEAGHRCAIPTCRRHPVDIEHIDDWATVREHRFENLIALCPTCHRRKGSGPDQIDRKSLRQYKTNLGILNHRYSETERRLIEVFANLLEKGKISEDRIIRLGVGSDLLLWYLIQDGYLESRYPGELDVSTSTHQLFRFTPPGIAFLRRWMEARPLDVEHQEPDTIVTHSSEVPQPQQLPQPLSARRRPDDDRSSRC
ncbi:HNH endonuclease [Streptomyces sp. NBC_00320]|uniref:HNH endonuclease n=1 Tax=Streptomyces sp. NBC_00320 TaxID=2975711 RepID=UPI0022578F70|nr:HNH endonuclease signature motif containing protein [Streptomyces sp. NBC_00320]MCX5147211.1 HNH endonuclease [Streptomyces sp. NBC_00320]